jgi:hypothetical protein
MIARKQASRETIAEFVCHYAAADTIHRLFLFSWQMAQNRRFSSGGTMTSRIHCHQSGSIQLIDAAVCGHLQD